jgi:hypothetical protein
MSRLDSPLHRSNKGLPLIDDLHPIKKSRWFVGFKAKPAIVFGVCPKLSRPNKANATGFIILREDRDAAAAASRELFSKLFLDP